jgi:ferric-dicitrate binding protein FerR (iron transport regulator)
MDQPSFDIEELLFRQLQGTLSKEETARLEAWKAQRPENNDFATQLTEPARLTEKLRLYADHQQEAARREAIRHLFPQQRTISLRRWWAAAAVLLLLVGTGYLYIRQSRKPDATGIAMQTAEIGPGRQGAMLTLANGSQLLLDTIKNGVIALQGGVTVKIVKGSLQYIGRGSGTLYNTMSTPKGRIFQLLLPDGTQVWLNSASSIRYPIAFNDTQRKVEITGEVYFEVAADQEKPFVVDINKKGTVTVLGTHFNVNAYDNEQQVAATLLEGAIQVKRLDAALTLKPGQQAVWQPDAGIKLVNDPNISKVMAWKNGLFNFEGASLEEVMRQLERWYDIEVVFEKPVPDIRFGGKMTRGITLNEMLDILKGFEGADLKFRMEGTRRLVVSQ